MKLDLVPNLDPKMEWTDHLRLFPMAKMTLIDEVAHAAQAGDIYPDRC